MSLTAKQSTTKTNLRTNTNKTKWVHVAWQFSVQNHHKIVLQLITLASVVSLLDEHIHLNERERERERGGSTQAVTFLLLLRPFYSTNNKMKTFILLLSDWQLPTQNLTVITILLWSFDLTKKTLKFVLGSSMILR